MPAAAVHAAETSPPVTTPSPIMGTYGTAQNVTLTCSDGSGSGCAATYYCLGTGCTPTTSYAGPVTVDSTTTLSFYSTDLNGNSEQVRTYAYSIDSTQAYRFERLWPELPQPWPFGGSYFAFDSSGNAYVADSSNNRIKKFDTNGFFVTSWGSAGSGNGQFNNPNYIAVDSVGNVYVADTNNHRIQKFTANGVFLTKWGTNGYGDGQFYWPRGIAVDPAGNVFVVDSQNYRIQKFTSDGIFTAKWGTNGTATGQFNSPQAITVDSSGNVYVSESNNNRIQKFDTNGVFMATWGASGSGDGQFDFPLGMAVDSTGNIYVADANNNRVQKFTSTGVFITKWSPASGGSSPNGIAINPEGIVYINAIQLQKFTSSGVFLGAIATSGNSAGVFKSPQGVAVGPSGHFYVTDSSNHRIQKFDSGGAFVTSWGTFGNSNGKFSFPNSVTTDSAGNVYVVDSGNNRIQKFTPSGTHLSSWGAYGSGNGQFSSPYGIAVNTSGDIYVAESGNNRVQKFAPNGTYISSWGSPGSADGQFNSPKGIAVDSLGNVYVVDASNSRIQKFDANGTFIVTWGSAGGAAGQFVGPRGISVGPSDNVYVADTYNNRIQQFTSAGAYVGSLGNKGSGIGQFMYPEGIDIDPSGYVYVADTNNHRIQKFIPASAPNTPGAPADVTANAGNGQATVAFTAPSTNGGSAITSYTVTSTPDNLTASGTASPLTITGLTNGTPYTFTVIATNANGTGPASVPSNSIIPGLTTYPLSLEVTGTGTIQSSPAPDINCTSSCNQLYDSGTVVNLTAAPGSGYTFSGWSGACSGSGSCNVTMSQARSVTATFTYALPGAPTGVMATAGNGQATVSFTTPASNGGSAITSYTVTSSPGNIMASGTASPITVTGLTNGTAYTFTATATNTNGTGMASGPSNSATPAATSFSLSLTVIGSGTVHSSPAPDINCSGSCGQSYDSGTVVTLTATPGSGSYFSGWSGACSGTGSCSVTMSQARSVTASFLFSGPNGLCGSAHNSQSVDIPSASLCSVGTPSTVTGIGPWNWTCAGSGGGTTAGCSAIQAGGVFYRSTDGGVTWVGRATGIGFNSPIYALAPSPGHPVDGTVFLGTGGGTYKSTNSGDTWTLVQSGYSVQALAVSPEFDTDRTLFSGFLLAGVYKSSDGGTTWNTANSGLPSTQIRSLAASPDFAGDQTIFTGILSYGVYKSSNGGTNWVAANAGIDTITPIYLGISPNFAADQTIYAATTDGQYSGGGPHYHVYKSVNGGSTWSLSDTGLTGSISRIAISPAFASDHTLFAATSSGVYKSTDSGASWSQVNAAASSLAMSPAYGSDQTLFAGIYADNVYRSSNGGASWSPSSSDFATVRQLSALGISPAFASDHTVFAAAYFAGPQLAVSSGSGSFGNIQVGSSSTAIPVTIANGQFGDANLASAIIISGTGASQFAVSPGSCGSLTPVLPRNGQCTVNVTFSPTGTGSASATLQISSNAVMSPAFSISLSGTGVTASSTIISPATGYATNGISLLVSGTASCTGCTVSMVEISADGGASWQAATGTASWSKSISVPIAGTYTIRSRATTSTGIVESPANGIIITVDRTPPTGTLSLYYGVWTLNANAQDGGVCVMVYPSICGTLEMSFDGILWQPATMTPGTGGPLWLRDLAGNLTGPIYGVTWNDNGGPIRIDGGHYYSSLQHALTAAGSGNIIKLTTTPHNENLVAATNATFTIKGGYDSNYGADSGTTPLSGTLTVQTGALTVENLIVAGSVTVEGGAFTANAVSIQ